jgi:hypothetical protein
MERFINAVRKQWAADDATVVSMWQSGRTIDEIRKVVPISEHTFWQILEVHASREAAGQ